MFPWLGRPPVAAQAAALRDLLLGERFRFADDDWRLHALDDTVAQLAAGKSPAPFALADPDFNRDLLAALVALDTIREETPYRVFSVRTFNDSKAFEPLKVALATLARRHGPGWDELTPEEALRELGLAPNPTHVYLSGPWRLVTAAGQVVTLDGFHPAVGVPTTMVARVQRAEIDPARVNRVICVENLASFYELIRYEGDGLAALCLWGNPAPPVRHLLARLVETLPEDIPLQVWADLDYGGLNILAQLRRLISPRFLPHRMDWGDPGRAHALGAAADRERPTPSHATPGTRLVGRSSTGHRAHARTRAQAGTGSGATGSRGASWWGRIARPAGSRVSETKVPGPFPRRFVGRWRGVSGKRAPAIPCASHSRCTATC